MMFIEVSNLVKSYKTGDVEFRALNGISFSVKQKEKCVILGPSGSGKSTLLNIIGGIDKVDDGKALVDNTDITKLNDNKLTQYRRDFIGYIFQFYNLVPNLTVYENIEVAANVCSHPLSIDDILKAVKMSELRDRFPRELSGGQQQRVSVARALIKKPSLLLCDEPTGSLDYGTSKEILKLLEDINNQFDTTMLIITHNTAIAGMADHIIKLRGGEISEDAVNKELISAERIAW